jgi:Zn-dependent protease
LLWVACVFVSILVHEFGHGLSAERFSASSSVLLYGLGGLCFYHPEPRGWPRRLAIILAGPGAGFMLYGVVLLVASLSLGITFSENMALTRAILGLGADPRLVLSGILKFPEGDTWVASLYNDLVYINLCWGLVNLLPIWPLDGGRASEILLKLVNTKRGQRWTHVISLLTAGGLAIYAYTMTSDLFMTLFFASFAMMNYQNLSDLHERERAGFDEGGW